MSQGVIHTGVVVAADGRYAKVLIDGGKADGCARCSVRSVCSPLGAHDDAVTITARVHDSSAIGEGDRVVVEISDGARWRAVAISFALPCLLVLIVVVAGRMLGFGDEVSALSALVVTVMYFGVLYVMRGRLQAGYRWRVIGKA